MKKTICALGALFALAMNPASAAVVDGMVQQGSGSFVELDAAAGFTVGKNDFDTKALYAFNETQKFKLTADLNLDSGMIKAGTVVSSHYVFFDPKRYTRQIGYVDFDGDILGIASSFDTLLATDVFGSDDVTYRSVSLRGLESPDTVAVDDTFSNRLNVDWKAGSPGDYVRVFTLAQVAVVPLPASGMLLLGGLAGAAGLRRLSKRR